MRANENLPKRLQIVISAPSFLSFFTSHPELSAVQIESQDSAEWDGMNEVLPLIL